MPEYKFGQATNQYLAVHFLARYSTHLASFAQQAWKQNLEPGALAPMERSNLLDRKRLPAAPK